MRNNPRLVALLIFNLAFISTVCSSHDLTRWDIPPNAGQTENVVIRRFNASIRTIDGKHTSFPHVPDLLVSPGEHSLTIKPEMWVSTFPSGPHLEETRQISFNSQKGDLVYICLGLSKWNPNGGTNLTWEPFTVVTRQGTNATKELLGMMQTKGGCFSNTKMIPQFWIDE